jgi:hypothetical protein
MQGGSGNLGIEESKEYHTALSTISGRQEHR